MGRGGAHDQMLCLQCSPWVVDSIDGTQEAARLRTCSAQGLRRQPGGGLRRRGVRPSPGGRRQQACAAVTENCALCRWWLERALLGTSSGSSGRLNIRHTPQRISLPVPCWHPWEQVDSNLSPPAETTPSARASVCSLNCPPRPPSSSPQPPRQPPAVRHSQRGKGITSRIFSTPVLN